MGHSEPLCEVGAGITDAPVRSSPKHKTWEAVTKKDDILTSVLLPLAMAAGLAALGVLLVVFAALV